MKNYIETILDDLNSIKGITEIENAIDLIDRLRIILKNRSSKDLENYIACCNAFINKNGKCKGYQMSRFNNDIAERCKNCKDFEGEYEK